MTDLWAQMKEHSVLYPFYLSLYTVNYLSPCAVQQQPNLESSASAQNINSICRLLMHDAWIYINQERGLFLQYLTQRFEYISTHLVGYTERSVPSPELSVRWASVTEKISFRILMNIIYHCNFNTSVFNTHTAAIATFSSSCSLSALIRIHTGLDQPTGRELMSMSVKATTAVEPRRVLHVPGGKYYCYEMSKNRAEVGYIKHNEGNYRHILSLYIHTMYVLYIHTY